MPYVELVSLVACVKCNNLWICNTLVYLADLACTDAIDSYGLAKADFLSMLVFSRSLTWKSATVHYEGADPQERKSRCCRPRDEISSGFTRTTFALYDRFRSPSRQNTPAPDNNTTTRMNETFTAHVTTFLTSTVWSTLYNFGEPKYLYKRVGFTQ